jgi:hypothetical protein
MRDEICAEWQQGRQVRLEYFAQEESCVLCIAFSRKYESPTNHNRDDRATDAVPSHQLERYRIP